MPSPLKSLYLIAYNVVTGALWLAVLAALAAHIDSAKLAFADARWALIYGQHAALLEILHSATGLVPSPLVTTVIQVASRIILLDIFTLQAPECQEDVSLIVMLAAWSVTEVVRYSFYACSVALGGQEKVPYALFWLRYSLFKFLYPLGILGECLQQVASYPHWRRTRLTVVERFSHVYLALLYVPLAPFMVQNMNKNRAAAFKKRAAASAPPPSGLVWPVTNPKTKERGSTETSKKIWAASARGSGAKDAELEARAIEREKNWRWAYTKRVVGHVQLLCESPIAAEKAAKAGLAKAHEVFEFIRDGKSQSLASAMQPGKFPHKFFTGTVKGSGKPVSFLRVPYKKKTYDGEELLRLADDWVANGIIEQSAGEAIKLVSTKGSEFIDLTDKTFCVFGAASVMGPTDLLLAHGATVVAMDIPRPAVWQGLLRKARASAGTMVFPMSKPMTDCKTDDDIAACSGCDLLQQTPEIADWLVQMNKPMVVGNYTYLDGALHVQLAVACDAIAQRLLEAVPGTALAFLCTPTDVHIIPRDARDAAHQQHAVAPAWQRLLERFGLLVPNIYVPVTPSMHCIVDASTSYQGPNYALAKRLQHWRAMLAHKEHVVSSNIAPASASASVLSNPQFGAAYWGWRFFPPLEVFNPETSSAVMFALLVNDLRNPKSAANPKFPLNNPQELFSHNSVHGGLWRCAYTLDTLGVPAAVSFYLIKGAPFILGGLAVVVAAALYIGFGFPW